MKKLFWLGLSLVVSTTLFQGCASYKMKPAIPNGIETIYVKTVVNKIPLEAVYAYEPGLEISITNEIIERLHIDGNLKVVEESSADAILEANLIGFEQEPVRFTRFESVEEYRLFMVLDMRLIDQRSGEVLWREPSFTGDQEYFITEVRSIEREKASASAIKRLARNVVDRIVEDW